jgi:hypothetical protein
LKPLDPRTTTPRSFGGHVHSPDDQLLGTVDNANNPSATPGRVTEGNTPFTLVYTAPEASGEVKLETKWEPPFGYECENEDEDDLGDFTNPCFGINHFNIGFSGLEALPPDPFYTVLRDPATAPTHPEGNFGTPAAIHGLASLAVYYKLAAFVTLSINDMSLPQGGLFDVDADWAAPHSRHRVGINADINQLGIPCLGDFALAIGVFAIGARLTCEPEGRKHITFNR